MWSGGAIVSNGGYTFTTHVATILLQSYTSVTFKETVVQICTTFNSYLIIDLQHIKTALHNKTSNMYTHL